MVALELTSGFIDSLAALDRADGRRVAVFLGKLLDGPEAPSLAPEIVHDAHDHAVRSYRVTHDLRAIAAAEADHLVLLHVARHDRAYVWARGHCFECVVTQGRPHVSVTPAGSPAIAHEPTSHVASREDLSSLLHAHGLGALTR
jgi:hypothetical protein